MLDAYRVHVITTTLIHGVKSGSVWFSFPVHVRVHVSSPNEAVPDVYILIHTFETDESENVIHYHPSDDQPYLDICKAAELVLGDQYTPGKDSLQLLGPRGTEPDMELYAADRVGTRVFKGFHEGPLIDKDAKKKGFR